MSETGPDGDEPQRARIRRAPKLGAFIAVGVVAGIAISVILTSTREVDPQVGFVATAAYLALYGIAAGALLGALVGVVLDAVLSRRSGEAVVARDLMEPRPDSPPAAEAESPVSRDVAAPGPEAASEAPADPEPPAEPEGPHAP